MERTNKNVVWHTGILPPSTLRAMDFLAEAEWLSGSGWYLAGGTALALHVGHRSSEDLDFFTSEKDFVAGDVLRHLSGSDWKTDLARDGTIWTEYLGAKVSFIAYPFFIPLCERAMYGRIAVADPRDIAVMKVIALSQRGRKRDFVDIYWYSIHKEPLLDVVKRLPRQYPGVAHDYHHILKAMLYFEDAEEDPMPKIHFDADWKTIKQYFKQEVPKIAGELLGIAK